MPWIVEEDRTQYEHSLQDLVPRLTEKRSGDLTYILYEIPTRIFSRTRRWTVACILLGAMVGALLCFFIRHVWPYEKEKQDENGPTRGDKDVDEMKEGI
jgi:hypothetical protein